MNNPSTAYMPCFRHQHMLQASTSYLDLAVAAGYTGLGLGLGLDLGLGLGLTWPRLQDAHGKTAELLAAQVSVLTLTPIIPCMN